MQPFRWLAAAVLLYVATEVMTFAQSPPYLYRLTFRGVSYQTNSTGSFVPVPLTEKSLMEDTARTRGVDINSLVLVYHIQNNGLGDTIEVVDAATGSTYSTLFGLFFGDDVSLGRTAATNSSVTQIRRLDYIYTSWEASTYTSWNNHSMGSAFTTKRFLTDALGNVRATIDSEVQWSVNPQAGRGTKLCKGTFTTVRPFR